MVAGGRVQPDSCMKRSGSQEALRGGRSSLVGMLKLMEVLVQTTGGMLSNEVHR